MDAGRMLDPPGTAARALLVELDAHPLGNLNPELNAKVLDELRGYGRG